MVARRPLLRLAAVQVVERKQDLPDLTPEYCFILAEPNGCRNFAS